MNPRTPQPAKLSTTFSTGGGGSNFERHVQAYFLFHMISHDPCPILEQPISQMDFQTKLLGWDTDDLLITAVSDSGAARLLCQIKHDITISMKNAVFQEVVTAAWSDFQKPSFIKESDRIALIAATTGKSSKSAMEKLHDYAACTKTVDDFMLRVHTAHYSANSVRDTYDAIKGCIQTTNDTDVWQFLKCFTLYLMDLDAGSNNSLYHALLSSIRCYTIHDPEFVWNTLSEQCGIWNQKGFSVTPEDIPQKILDLFYSDSISTTIEEHLDIFPTFDLSMEAVPFAYDCVDLPDIWGRDTQLEQLRIFAEEDNQRFRFCVVTGPAGIGKSKLVFHFARQFQAKKVWLVRKVPLEDIPDLGQIHNWNAYKNILLVIDYANEQEKLGKLLRILSHQPETRQYGKIRLILIAREGTSRSPYRANDIILPQWYERIIKCDRSIHQRLFLKDFINLRGLSRTDCDALYTAFTSNHLHIHPSESAKEYVLNLIDETVRDEDGFVRPLYALFVMDLYHGNPETKQWTLEKMQQQIYQRDKERWRSEINNESLFIALLNLLLYATIFDHWDSGQLLAPPLDRDCHVVFDAARTGDGNQKAKWFKMLTGHIEWRRSKPVLTRLTPDMVGEFYALNELHSLDAATQRQWLHLILSRFSECREFFIRAIQDFGNNQDHVEIFLDIFEQMIPLLAGYDEDAHYIFASILEVFYTNFTDEEDPLCCDIEKLLHRYINTYRSKSVYAAELELLFHKNIRDAHGSHTQILEELYAQWPDSEKIASRLIRFRGEILARQIRSQPEGQHRAFTSEFDLLRRWAGCSADEIKRALIPALIHIIKSANFIQDWETAAYVEDELLRSVMDQCTEEFLLDFICLYDSVIIESASRRTKVLSTLDAKQRIPIKDALDRRLETELSFYAEIIERNASPSFNFTWTYVSTLPKITKALFIYEGLPPETGMHALEPYLQNAFRYMLQKLKLVYKKYHLDREQAALARHASRALDMFCDAKSSAIPYSIKAQCILNYSEDRP